MLNNLRYQEKSGIVFSTNIAFIFNVLLENDFINRLRKQFFLSECGYFLWSKILLIQKNLFFFENEAACVRVIVKKFLTPQL